MKIDIIVQARYSSYRFPGKILKKIDSKTLFEILIMRLKKIKNINNIIVACSNNPNDIKIINLCKKMNLKYFVGSEKNVLKRCFLLITVLEKTSFVEKTFQNPLKTKRYPADGRKKNEAKKRFRNGAAYGMQYWKRFSP